MAGLLAVVGSTAGGIACLSPAPGTGVSLAAVVAVAALLGALQTACVSLVGEYVVRTYREVQSRPPWIVKRTIQGGSALVSRSESQAA